MIIMHQAEVYELGIVPPQAGTCTHCALLNNFRILPSAVCRLPSAVCRFTFETHV